MIEENNNQNPNELNVGSDSRRTYIKPEITKHQAAAVVSGGSSCDQECLYTTCNFGLTYYH